MPVSLSPEEVVGYVLVGKEARKIQFFLDKETGVAYRSQSNYANCISGYQKVTPS
jgi:hypothetical protein